MNSIKNKVELAPAERPCSTFSTYIIHPPNHFVNTGVEQFFPGKTDFSLYKSYSYGSDRVRENAWALLDKNS
ncbi:MAG: hypothetical protein ACI4WV_01225, partial [Eubacteriales bacterium]